MSATWSVPLVAIIAGLAGSFVVRAFARRFKVMNHPNPIIPQHVVATPYLGGVGVLVGIAGGVCVAVATGSDWPDIELGAPAILYCMLGVYDDVRPLAALPKIAAQIVIAACAVALGLRLPLTGIDALDAALALLWIVACVNAFNVTDVCDGLVTGLAVVFFLGWTLAGRSESVLAAASLGACLGFLPLNVPHASIFLGDAGSHLLGFLVAGLALSGPSQGPSLLPELLLVTAVPMYELIFITVVRIANGVPWYKGSRDHFSLRLQKAGWSRWQVDLLAWFTMAAGIALAVGFARWDLLGRYVVTCLVACFVIVATSYLLRQEVERNA